MCAYMTEAIEYELDCCEDIEDFGSKVIPLLKNQREMWAEKVSSIMSAGSMSVKNFAALCCVSEPAVRKWMRGSLPQSRDMYIRIAFAAGFGLEETNSFLLNYGRCPELYARSMEDAACIFTLTSPAVPHSYSSYLEMLEILRREISAQDVAAAPQYTTVELSEHLGKLNSREEMERFAKENAPAFIRPYAKLYNFILAFLDINLLDGLGESSSSFHAMATESGWSSSLRHCISEIRRGKWLPLRNKLISLGLHLNMDAEDIDTMLHLGKMRPLYVKNPVEAAVKFAINEAKLASEGDAIVCDGSNWLCLFVKDVLSRLELEESEYLIDDL